jgi:hypothetical protein
LKKSVPKLRAIAALQQGPIETFYATTPEEAEILLSICGEQSFPSLQVKPNPAIKRGGGFGEAEQNRLVERRAIKLVWQLYDSKGWRVESREHLKCGYDLRCVKGRREEHVEVKGVCGSTPAFIITACETKQAASNDRFVLYVVTSALDPQPKLTRCSGEDLRKSFLLEPIQYRALPRGTLRTLSG